MDKRSAIKSILQEVDGTYLIIYSRCLYAIVQEGKPLNFEAHISSYLLPLHGSPMMRASNNWKIMRG